jgi:hypothetical protein
MEDAAIISQMHCIVSAAESATEAIAVLNTNLKEVNRRDPGFVLTMQQHGVLTQVATLCTATADLNEQIVSLIQAFREKLELRKS